MWSTNFVTSNGIRLHYTRGGAGSRTLLALHGFSDDGQCWIPMLATLAATHDVIMLDARGHGRSDAPEKDNGNYFQAVDTLGVIQALKVEKPVLIGHSMGAITALAVASLFPTAPGAIVLEDPPAWWMPGSKGPEPERRAELTDRALMLKRKSHAELVAHSKAESPKWSDAERENWGNAKLRFGVKFLNDFWDSALDLPALVKNIACPVLLVTSDTALGGLVNDAHATELRKHVPQLQEANIPGAGHNVRRDQPVAYHAAVQKFLSTLA